MKRTGAKIRCLKSYSIIILFVIMVSSCSRDVSIDEPQQALNEALTNTPTSTPIPDTPISTMPPTSTSPPEVSLDEIAATPPMATAEPPTQTPTVPPAPHFNVEQAPYAQSDCSDKYPCNEDVAGWERRMRVPPGFTIKYFTRIYGQPTSITFGPDGLLYVADVGGNIFTVNSDGQVKVFFEGLIVPTGLAFQPGTSKLYVSSRLDPANEGGEGAISYIQDGKLTQIIDGLPCCYVGMHGPNGIAFGPSGFGYVGVGGRADHGEILSGSREGLQDELQPLEASIIRFTPDGSIVENYARGFRNAYDIAWDVNGNLYATDNGRDGDMEAGDNPPDELHRVVPGGEHGYPWYECPTCFSSPEGVEVIPPDHEFVPHAAAAGITVYLSDQWPDYYNDLFVVLWSAFEGAQKVVRFTIDDRNGELIPSDFATGFAAPIDLTVGPDGHLYVADFATGIIFRIGRSG
jgi:glucose/arabinose dehydrogenase